jgi:alpha-ketoglutarate-dependent taurine dioxygenase
LIYLVPSTTNYSKKDARRFIATVSHFGGMARFVLRHRWEPRDVVMRDNRCERPR